MRQFLLITCILCAFGVHAQDNRKVAVFNSVGNNVEAEFGDAVRDVLQEGFVKSGKFDVLEREQIEQVQKEIVFQANASDDQLVQMAAAVGADYSCFASITKIGINYQVACKVVDAGNAYKVIFMDSRRTKQTDANAVLIDLMDILDAIANEIIKNI